MKTNRTITTGERQFLDSLIALEARIRTEPLTPEARTQMLELTGKAKEPQEKRLE